MGMRRRARETALQVLYQMDVQPELSVSPSIERAFAHFAEEVAVAGDTAAPEARAFAERLVRGVYEKLAEIDTQIVAASRNWRIERMGRVDRNLLRLAIYEMRYCGDIPPKVALNEAIEIAKRYGAAETPAFINGILDRVLAEP